MTTMTKAERSELSKVARMNATVAKKDLEARGAQQLAEIEQQLARIYKADHEAIAHLTVKAQAMVDECNKELTVICRQLKVPDSFAPEFQLNFYSRGENADKIRRAELRKAAEAAVDANVAAGKVKIDRQVASICTQLVADGLTTEKAKTFLESIPSIDELMPKLALPELEQTRRTLTYDERRALRYELEE
jgi:hypothetical protein